MKNANKHFTKVGMVLIILWCIFTFVLVGWIVAASLSTTKGIFSNKIFSSGFHPQNYLTALVKHKVGRYFINSIIYTGFSIVGIILVAAPAAYVLARFRFKANMPLQNMFMTALGIPAIMIILPLFGMFTKLQLTNSRTSLVVLYICLNVPFTIFFLISFFKNISTSFEEAAAIDGCGPMRTFWSIIFPLAQSGIITVSIFNFITVWNEYFIALIFANKTELRPVAVGLYSMVQSMRYIGDWAGMFAAVVIVFLPTFIIYLFLSEKIIAGVTGGAIKG
ncbi:ABC-type sugar transport system, permease component [Sphaerochaeta pleomorpha str. Grapes]|uniref:ABC-type sugar transport system, permease component n=1 Tax=Sphaerochaeta pleomorpha (strain ATCC BAA-1885 / DSM 22778 / Grapes) TaxID=158190 RepID=G8QVN1_SPHPG|nr:carbohydrate ABC transporter permease [Sphaerochaeta pleomorpha]AEV29323.1 ABC-type sugar transport system, permease component [Sphaerochaeta pleomorpha str. Grapes]